MGSFNFSPVGTGLGLGAGAASAGASLVPWALGQMFNALWPWDPMGGTSLTEPSGNPLQPTGVSVNGPLQDPNNPGSFLGQGETAQFEYPQAWNDNFPWLKNYPPQEAKGFVDKMTALGVNPGSPTASADLEALLAKAIPDFSTTVTAPGAGSGLGTILPGVGAGAGAGIGLGEALIGPGAGSQVDIPGNTDPTKPTFTTNVDEKIPQDPAVSSAELLRLNPALASILAGTQPQVPYDPATPQYPELPKNPDFTSWSWDTAPVTPPTFSTDVFDFSVPATPVFPPPTEFKPQVPYDKAPMDYGKIIPGAIPPITTPPVTSATPGDPKIKLPTITPSVAGSGGGGGGAALPTGFPVVGDNSKMKSIFDLPLSMVPLDFIKALQLGGRS